MVLVTGASGFIGRYLVDELLKEGFEVGVLVNKTPIPSEWLKNGRVRVFTVDIARQTDFSLIPGEMEFEVVFHLAAYIPKNDAPSVLGRCLRVNCIGTNNLLQFCIERGVKRMINSSTVSVYGEHSSTFCRISEDTPLRPLSYYGISKLIGESLCERYSRISDLEVVTLRYSSVYGLGQDTGTVLPLFIDRSRVSKGLVIFGEGARLQDFVYVRDVVGANLSALRRNVQGVFNIGSGIGTSMITLAEAVVRVLRSSSKITFDASKEEGASGIIMDISKAQEGLGYRVNHELDSGLTEYSRMLADKVRSV